MRASKYKALIETGFQIIDKEGTKRPFILNDTQNSYVQLLDGDYTDLQGVRENIVKARQQGFSALIDAIFTVDFLLFENVGAQIISHKDEETKLLLNRVSTYIDSHCEKRGLSRKRLLKTDSNKYFENAANGSYIFIGTAGAKTLGRGGTLQNIHWSEVGFYPNTEVLNAEKLVTAAEQQVKTGFGKIFRESTGNMVGDFFYRELQRAKKGDSNFAFRFFPWYVFEEYTTPVLSAFHPTPEEEGLMRSHSLPQEKVLWYRNKSKEFETRALFLREYPTTFEEAFLASGAGFFDPDVLKYYREQVAEPKKTGFLAQDGGWI